MKYKVSIEKTYFFIPSVLSQSQPEEDSRSKALKCYFTELNEVVKQEKKHLDLKSFPLNLSVEIIQNYKSINNLEKVEKEIEDTFNNAELSVLKSLVLSRAEEEFEKHYGILNPEENPSIYTKTSNNVYHLTDMVFNEFVAICRQQAASILFLLNKNNNTELLNIPINSIANKTKRKIQYKTNFSEKQENSSERENNIHYASNLTLESPFEGLSIIE